MLPVVRLTRAGLGEGFRACEGAVEPRSSCEPGEAVQEAGVVAPGALHGTGLVQEELPPHQAGER